LDQRVSNISLSPLYPAHISGVPFEANTDLRCCRLVAGAAAYAAMRDYENEVGGKSESHAQAKQLIAGFASAEVDKIFAENGLTYLDKATAKEEAQVQAEEALADAGYKG
jgi:hypothetical protein